MSAPTPYDVVVSLAGHDRGEYLLVVGEEEDRILLCDGRNRRLVHPKSKSPKHVRVIGRRKNAPKTDREIRKTLALAAAQAAAKEERLLGER